MTQFKVGDQVRLKPGACCSYSPLECDGRVVTIGYGSRLEPDNEGDLSIVEPGGVAPFVLNTGARAQYVLPGCLELVPATSDSRVTLVTETRTVEAPVAITIRLTLEEAATLSDMIGKSDSDNSLYGIYDELSDALERTR